RCRTSPRSTARAAATRRNPTGRRTGSPKTTQTSATTRRRSRARPARRRGEPPQGVAAVRRARARDGVRGLAARRVSTRAALSRLGRVARRGVVLVRRPDRDGDGRRARAPAGRGGGAAFGGRGAVGARRLGGGVQRALLFVLGPLAAPSVHLLLSPKREYEADRFAAELCGSPHGLADALLRLEAAMELVAFEASPATEPLYTTNPFAEEGLATLFITHPPLGERVRRLRALDPEWREKLRAA